MSSLISEDSIFTIPNPSVIGPRIDEINLRQGTFVDVDITGTFNDAVIAGQLVFAESVQTLTNKSLQDSTTSFIDNTDGTIKAKIDCAGSTGTTSTLKFVQTVDRTYTIPDSGANCSIVTTEGNITINGVKTFSNLVASTISTNAINEATATSGHTLTGSFVSYNDIVKTRTGSTVQTVGAQVVTLFTVVTASNTAYLFTFEALGTTSTGSTSSFESTLKVKNVAGVLTISTEYNKHSDPDADLVGTSVDFASSGTSVLVQVTGIAAKTINWRGALREVAMTI
jgi:hypothetical protein